MSRQECKGGREEFGLTSTRPLEEAGTLLRRSGQGFLEQRFFIHGPTSAKQPGTRLVLNAT